MSREAPGSAGVTQDRRRGRGVRIYLILVAVGVLVVVPGSYFIGRAVGDSDAGSAWPVVGADLHAVSDIEGTIFVSGHTASAARAPDGRWRPIASLNGIDAMAWTQTPQGILVAGHQGVFSSVDGGSSFTRSNLNLPATDVHAIGASGQTLYLASPTAGLFGSQDAGNTFRRISGDTAFMGSIAVDPRDPRWAIAADINLGAVMTTDGGRTWRRLNSPGRAVAVAWNPRNRRDIALATATGVSRSLDGGAHWAPSRPVQEPATVGFTPAGQLLIGVWAQGQARVYRDARSAGRLPVDEPTR